jgi:hypothetical protein
LSGWRRNGFGGNRIRRRIDLRFRRERNARRCFGHGGAGNGRFTRPPYQRQLDTLQLASHECQPDQEEPANSGNCGRYDIRVVHCCGRHKRQACSRGRNAQK